MSTGKDRKGYASTSAAVFPFQAHNAEPGKSWSDRHSPFSQHLLQLTVTVPHLQTSVRPQNIPENAGTLNGFMCSSISKRGMISLSPPTICNSALERTNEGRQEAKLKESITNSC